MAASIFIVWGVNTADKIAAKIIKKSVSLLCIGAKKIAYTTVKLLIARLIYDIAEKPKVPYSLKAELSERELALPADLPVKELATRLKSRLITD